MIIGEGGEIQQQYPQPDVKLSKGSTVLLRTEGEIEIPNFTGWSKKMVLAYKTMTGLNIQMSGSGYVTKQNKAEGERVTNQDQITLTLKEPAEKYREKTDKKRTDEKKSSNE